MLESLGYSEAAERARGRPDPLQHVLDPRDRRQPLHRAPRRGQAPQARTTRADRRRGRLLGAVGQGGGVRALPVRRRRVRPGAGAQARGVPHQRLADRAGLLRVRGLHRPAAGAPRARPSRAGCRSASAATALLLLHRALDARARGQPPIRGARSRRSARWPPRACARSRCSGRTSTPTGATCGAGGRRSFAELLASARRDRRASSASATRAPIRRTCART